MKFLCSIVSLAALATTTPLVTAADRDATEEKQQSGLRLVSQQNLPINQNERDLMSAGEYIWEEMESNGKKRRRKRGGEDDSSSDSSSSKGSKSGGKGGSSSSSSSKGSKGSKGGSNDGGREEKCYGDDCGDDDDDDKGACFECGPTCEVAVYEFVGQTGRLIGNQKVDPIYNVQFNNYVQDDDVYEPNGQLSGNSTLTNPSVYNTAKCLQVRLGKQCEGQENTPEEDRVCCEGLTMCDIQYSLSDNLGYIGDIVVSGGLTDNAVNVLPIVGGTGGFTKAYGEVVVVAEYFDPAIDTCPNIGEVELYNVAAKIYVEQCEYEHTFYAQEQQQLPKIQKKNRKKALNNFGW